MGIKYVLMVLLFHFIIAFYRSVLEWLESEHHEISHYQY